MAIHFHILLNKKYVKQETRIQKYGSDSVAVVAMDFNRRFVAAFLALVFVLTSIIFGVSIGVKAEDPKPEEITPDSNLVLEKNIAAETDGTYTLTLSAYSKGLIKNTTKQIPTDYILVVDQSGSMETQDMPTEYVEATMPSGGWTFDSFENGVDYDGNPIDKELYIQDKNDPSVYYRVYRKWGPIYEYVPRNTLYIDDVIERNGLRWWTSSQDVDNQTFYSQYYYRPSLDHFIEYYDPSVATDNHFYPLKFSASRGLAHYKIRLSYTDINNNQRTVKYYYDPSDDDTNMQTSRAIFYRNSLSSNVFKPGDRAVFSYDTINAGVVLMGNGNGFSVFEAISNAVSGSHPNSGAYDAYTFAKIDFLTLQMDTGMIIQNDLFIGHVGYNALAYRDANGEEHIVSQTEFCDSNGNPTTDMNGNQPFSVIIDDETGERLHLYEPTGTKQTRLVSLQNALNSFAGAVASQTDTGGHVDHRVAIVGFSSNGFNNNELLTNTTEGFSVNHYAAWTNPSSSAAYSTNGYAHDGIQKSQADGDVNSQYYTNALIPAYAEEPDSDGINDALLDGIAGLTAHGGTQPELGLDMAYAILDNSNKKNEYASGERNAVVIFFTDGRPGDYSTSNQYSEANQVIGSANAIKTNIPGVQIYSVGVFGEADANPLTYPDTKTYIYYEPTELQAIYESLDCNSKGNRNHNTDTNEHVANNSNLTDVRISPYNYSTVDAKPEYFAEKYYPDYAKADSSHYGDTTATWTWSTGGIVGIIGATSHTASSPLPVYQLRFFFRDYMRNNPNYPKVENDTIFDYMSVVSSSYPNATSFDANWWNRSRSNKETGNYTSAIHNARGDKAPGRYYMSASDSNNLNSIFTTIAGEATAPAVASDAQLYLQDIVSNNFEVPSGSFLNDHVTVNSYIGSQDKANGSITFSETPTNDSFNPHWDASTKQLTIDDFNFSANYIMYGKPADATEETGENQGKKLVVTISGLTPNSNAPTDTPFASNAANSGILQDKSQDGLNDVLLDEFVSPEITRYKYDLSVGSDDTAAVFDLNYVLDPTSQRPADEDKAIVFRGSNTAKRYDQATSGEFSATNYQNPGANMYVEYITKSGKDAVASPSDYELSAHVSINSNNANTANYTYYLGTSTPVAKGNNVIDPDDGIDVVSDTNWNSTKDSTLYVVSDTKNRDVIIHLAAAPSPFVDDNYEFTVEVTWEKDGQTGSQTLTMPYNNGQIADQTVSVPYGSTVTVSHSDYFYDTKISETAGSGTSDPYTATNIVATRDIYITDTARDNIGEGVMEDSNANKAILYVLAGIALLSAGAGAIYIYRKKDVFSE